MKEHQNKISSFKGYACLPIRAHWVKLNMGNLSGITEGSIADISVPVGQWVTATFLRKPTVKCVQMRETVLITH